MRKSWILGLLAGLWLLGTSNGFSQADVRGDVHLFQNFLLDAPIASTFYGEGGLAYSTYEFFNAFQFGIRGGYPITPKFEMGGEISYINADPDQGDGESGISDLTVAGRYNVMSDKANLSVGGYITLPIGSEDVGQSNTDFAAFGALRYPFSGSKLILTGTVALEFLEAGDDRETSLLIAPGLLVPATPQLSFIGELNIRTEGEYMLLSGGLDYSLKAGSHLRGGIGLGLDDGAPDFLFLASFLHNF